jgi:peroxiredoxin
MLRRLSFLMLICACAPAQPTIKAAPAPTVAAQALPVIELVTLDGKPTQIAQALGGRPALVSLWATWCEACASEFEPLQRLSERAHSLGAVVLAVAVGEPRAKVAAFVRSHQLSYPQLVDEQFHFADSAGQKKVPATLVIDRQGRIVYSGGVLDEIALAALERAITGTTSATR